MKVPKALASRGWRHWLGAAVVILAAMIVTEPLINGYPLLKKWRFWMYQTIAELSPRPLEPRHVRIVLIGDDEYWRGYPAGRRPLKRDFLASIVEKLDDAGARVIALDFDLRLQDPGGSSVPSDYAEETTQLMHAIREAAKRRKIVLAKTVARDSEGGYRFDPDSYSAFGLCTDRDAQGRWENPGTADFRLGVPEASNIRCGYIVLPRDKRKLPGTIEVGDSKLDAFAIEVARAHQAHLVPIGGVDFSYASFIPQSRFVEAGVIIPVEKLLSGDGSVRDALNGFPVIVGADWSSLAYGRGSRIDSHETPVGYIRGALLHANFVEAVLDDRTARETPKHMHIFFELVIGAIGAITFALAGSWAQKVVVLFGVSVVMAVTQYLTFSLVGVLFDAFPIILGLWIHSMFD
jgi:CHASE2 domain-containing sensor protein